MEELKHFIDALSITTTIATLAGFLPPLAALVSILWIGFQFYHSEPMRLRRLKNTKGINMDLTGIGSVFEFGKEVLNRFIPDPTQRAAAELELYKAQQAGEFKEADIVFQLAKGQIDTNIAEASSPNLFVSGWRPYIGWVCGTGLAYQFLIFPILVAFVPKISQLDMGTLLTLLLGMLGLGAMRTTEKLQGKA